MNVDSAEPQNGFKKIWLRKKPENLSEIDPAEVGGFEDGFFKALAADIGFNFTYRFPADGQWGSKNSRTGEWNGILRELQDYVMQININYIQHGMTCTVWPNDLYSMTCTG